MTIRFPTDHFLLVDLWNKASISITVYECDAVLDITLNDLYEQVKVIYFGTNRFLIYDFL